MNPLASAHLTDEQFSTSLIHGAPPPECAAHLAACAPCREELSTFLAAAGDFDSASLAWIEAKQATSRPSLRAALASRARTSFFAPLGMALAAALLLILGVPAWNHGHRAPAGPQVTPSFASEDSEAEIAQDNNLLRSVDMVLGVSEPSPFREYGLPAGTPQELKMRSTRSRVQ